MASSLADGNSGRLITDRHTREEKKTTKAAAVHGSPPCHPNARTATAPNANSVSQKERTNQQSTISNQQSQPSLSRCRPRRVAFEEASEEFFHPVERVEISLVQQRLVCVVGEDNQLVIHVVCAQELHEPGRLRELHVPVVVSMHEQHRRL